MHPFDPTSLDILLRLSKLQPTTKEAFTPSPAIAQQVMGQAQAGADPGVAAAMAGGAGGGPGGPGGPGGDPAAQGGPPGGAPGGAPPGADPAAAGGAPPDQTGSPAAAPQDPTAAKLDQILQLMQAGGGGAGGMGPNGKPNTASVKFEPQHFHTLVHKISNMEAVLTRLADAMGLEVPASELLQQPAPGSSAAPMPGPAGQAGAGQAQPAAAPAGPPPSQIAQQLPALPAVAGKAAADTARRLAGGFAVSKTDSMPASKMAKLANLAVGLRKAS